MMVPPILGSQTSLLEKREQFNFKNLMNRTAFLLE